jgi:tRNA U55 pseudouridine synthase TruB
VRVLAADLGHALGTCAHLGSLRRTACGAFEVKTAVRLDDLEIAAREGRLPLLSPSAALEGFRAVVVDERTIHSIRHGQQWALGTLGAPREASEVVRVADRGGALVAIATATPDATTWQLARVFGADTLPSGAAG